MEHAAYDDGWLIRQDSFDLATVGRWETLFALANGQLGIRSVVDDGRSSFRSGTFINGFYETEPIVYGEEAYGFAKNRQRMLNVTEGANISVWIGDDPFDLSTGTIEHFERVLNLRTGILKSSYRWRSPSGVVMTMNAERVVPLSRRATAGFRWTITTPHNDVPVTLISGIDSKAKADVAADDPRVGATLTRNALTAPKAEVTGDDALLAHTVRNTRFRIVCAMAHHLETTCHAAVTSERQMNDLRHRFVVSASAGVPITLEKFLHYETARARRTKIGTLARRAIRNAREVGFDGLAAEQREYLDVFWQTADIEIGGDPELQHSLRFNLFHVLQAAGRDGHTNMGAKGLTGEGYEGHYFWDTEIYAMPVCTYLMPETARRLIEYRYSTLPQARARARELSHEGALYPWRTINGEEASAYFPAGTAQYHINADIAYAARRYLFANPDDFDRLVMITEMAIETARFWLSLGSFIPGRGFCINCVTGPDEYTAIVNNNLYTNVMARENLRFAVDLVRRLEHDHPSAWEDLQTSLWHLSRSVSEIEIDAWQRAADEMRIPRDADSGLYPQDDSFFEKAVWDLAATPRDRFPLLLHYHPLNIYRHQVLKQPDVVMAMYLVPDAFDPALFDETFRYYERLTTGDSSLAACVQSIVAAAVGDIDLAERYFRRTVRMDLDDINGNARDGIHAAAMAGTWLSIVYGFAGMRDHRGILSFAPRLPEAWRHLAFRLRWRGATLAVRIEHDAISYRWDGALPLPVVHCGSEIEIAPGEERRIARC